jgi:hypothetical protein
LSLSEIAIVTDSGLRLVDPLNPKTKKEIPERDRKLQARLRLAGAIILLAGLTSAALIYRFAVTDYDSAYVKLLNNTKKNEYDMELIGGKANILASEIREWFAGLWHGKGLAHTLTFLSVGGSLACFFVAHRLNHTPVEEDRRNTGDPGG